MRTYCPRCLVVAGIAALAAALLFRRRRHVEPGGPAIA